jgi:hypothetical protein
MTTRIVNTEYATTEEYTILKFDGFILQYLSPTRLLLVWTYKGVTVVEQETDVIPAAGYSVELTLGPDASLLGKLIVKVTR